MVCLTQEVKKFVTTLTKFSLFVLILNFAGYQNQAFAGSSASATANVSATVLTSIAITKTRDLAFGNGAPGDAAKVVAATDAANSASFNVTGAANAAYNITLPSAAVVLANGANTINVTAFTSSPATSGNLGAGGAQTITVGATRAALSATQAVGTYTGSFTVTVTYQ